MGQLYHFLITIARQATIAVLCCAFCLPAAQAGSKTDYAKDGKVAAKACFDHLSGKPPTTAIRKAGYVVWKNDKRFILFYKPTENGDGPFLGAFYWRLGNKHRDLDYRRCTFVLPFPFRYVNSRSPNEYHVFMAALRGTFRSNGYKHGIIKNIAGLESDNWTGKNGTYQIRSGQLSGISVEVFKK
ncbi:MAG: hypothetical protein WAO69_12000 [Aestuariivita sp.]|uniref:hypothetical protein n=1 Tax=Aestuariivita sp. TaxID=1872407 RepID=UPI003BAEA7BE